MPLLQILRPTLPILIGASIMLTLSMGLRQSLGIFMQPLTQDIHISVSDFTLALALQNLAWGFLQPLAGAMTVRYGFRPIMMVGTLFYIVGLALMATAQGLLGVMIGGGVLIGISSGLYGCCDRHVGRGAGGPCDGPKYGAWHRLGRGITGRAALGPDRTATE